jgi:hypothetical protein
MNEDLGKELNVVLELAKKQATHIDRLESLVVELWGGITYARDAFDEMEAAIVGQSLKPLLDHSTGSEQKLLYAKENPIN